MLDLGEGENERVSVGVIQASDASMSHQQQQMESALTFHFFRWSESVGVGHTGGRPGLFIIRPSTATNSTTTSK
jgi:hypothetical protein